MGKVPIKKLAYDAIATIGIEACVVNACAGLAVYSGPFRQHQMTSLRELLPFCIVVKQMACWPMCVRVTVAMNSVCA